MPRWYAGFQCYGKPDATIETINRVIAQHSLFDSVPLIRVERDPKGQFYLFIGIESEQIGKPPSDLSPLLSLRALQRRIGSHFTLEEIYPMTGRDHKVVGYGHLPHLPPIEPADHDPFGGDLSSGASSPSTDAIKQAQRYDRLMLWLSAVGGGTYASFCAGCTLLGFEGGTHFRAILRRLKLLGHIELSADGKRWSVAPTVLARGQDRDDRTASFFLCGQRDASLLCKLRSIAETDDEPHARGSAPSMFRVQTDDAVQFVRELQAEFPAGEIVVAGNVGDQLADHIPSIDDWKQTLQPLPGLVPQMFDSRLWTGEGFAPGPFEGQTGFYELWPLDQAGLNRRPMYTALYDKHGDKWLRGDWYGLRFLSYHAIDGRCPVRYNAESRQLEVHVAWSWPELYERALVLSSGRLPQRNRDRLIYSNVSDRLIATLSPKLRLRFE